MSSRTQKPSIIRKVMISIGWLLALIYLLYAAAGFWLAPNIIKTRLTEQLQQNVGGTFSVEKINFNPFTLKLQLDQLMLTDSNQMKWLTVNSIEVDMDLIDLFKDAITVSSIEVYEPILSIQLNSDGSVMLPALSAETSSSDQAGKFLLQTLAVNNGSLKLQYANSAPLSAKNISLQLSDLSDQDLFSDGSLELNLSEGGLVKLTTDTQQSGLYDVQFEGINIPVSLFNTWLAQTSVDLNKGTLNAVGQLNWKMGSAPIILFNSVELNQLDLSLGEQLQAFLPHTHLSNSALDLSNNSLTLDKITITGGQTQLLKPQLPTPSSISKDNTAALSINNPTWFLQLNSTELVNHTLRLDAWSLSSDLPPAIEISQLTIRDMTLAADQAAEIKALIHLNKNDIDQYSQLNANLMLQPFDLTGELNTQSIDLTQWQSLMVDPQQLTIDSGQMTAQLVFSLTQERWRVTSQLQSSNLTINSVGTKTQVHLDDTSHMDLHIDSTQKEITIACFSADLARLLINENTQENTILYPKQKKVNNSWSIQTTRGEFHLPRQHLHSQSIIIAR